MPYLSRAIAVTASAAALIASAPPSDPAATPLPTNPNGFSMVMTPSSDLDAYRMVDMLCVAPGEYRFTAFANDGAGRASFIAPRDDGTLEVTGLALGEADPAAGSFRIPFAASGNPAPVGHFTFTNPGVYGDPARLAMPTLSSVEIGGERAECMFDPAIVYLGVTDTNRMIVTAAENGSLTLTVMDGAEIVKTVGNGHYATGKADEIVYLFMEGEELTMIKAAPRTRQSYPAWTMSSPDGRNFGDSPRAFFSADMQALGAREWSLPHDLAIHLDRLEICRHLSGEWSGEAERDAQVAESWGRARCDEAVEGEATFQAEYADNPAVSAILASRRIVE